MERQIIELEKICSRYISVNASLVAQMVRNFPVMKETWRHRLKPELEDPLEKGMATHSSVLGAFLVTQTIKDLPPMQETRRLRLHPWAGKIPWRRAWQGT